MLQHLSRASTRVNASLGASRKALVSSLAVKEVIEPSKLVDEGPRATWTAFLRVWRAPNGLSETLLITNEIEKRYGKIRETHYLKDYEMPHKCQMLAYIIFEDPQSVQRIPRGGIDHAIESSSSDETEAHKLSLEDVEALIYPPSSAVTPSDVEIADKGAVLGFRLIPAGKDYVDSKHTAAAANRIFQATPLPLMEAFYNWRGFHSAEPLDLPSEQFTNAELFNAQGVQSNIRMQAALKLCEFNLKQNPLAKPQQDSPTSTPSSSEYTEQPPTPVSTPNDATTPEKDPASSGKDVGRSKKGAARLGKDTVGQEKDTVTPEKDTPKPEKPSPSPQRGPKAKKSQSTISGDSAPPLNPEVIKPELSRERQVDLANQLKAARDQKKAAREQKKIALESKFPAVVIPSSLELPTRRKQAKPAVKTYVDIRGASEEPEAPEETSKPSIVDRLWSFVGRKS